MRTKLFVLMSAAVLVAALVHAVEKSKLPPSAKAPNTGTMPGLTPGGPITAPSNFHGAGPMATSSTTIDLGWTDNSNNEDKFRICRKFAGQANYPETPIAMLPANTTKYQDTGLQAETSYSYILAASRGEGTNSTWSTAVETIAMTNPRPPANLQAKATGAKQVKLAWPNASKAANLIMIERSTGNSNSFQKIFQTQPVNIATYVDEGLAPNTQYFYRLVVVKLPFNASDYTPAVSVVTPAQ